MSIRNTITCGNLEQLADICARLVRHGVTFEANAEYLTITLTGGY